MGYGAVIELVVVDVREGEKPGMSDVYIRYPDGKVGVYEVPTGLAVKMREQGWVRLAPEDLPAPVEQEAIRRHQIWEAWNQPPHMET